MKAMVVADREPERQAGEAGGGIGPKTICPVRLSGSKATRRTASASAGAPGSSLSSGFSARRAAEAKA